jgi:hypothetical protein
MSAKFPRFLQLMGVHAGVDWIIAIRYSIEDVLLWCEHLFTDNGFFVFQVADDFVGLREHGFALGSPAIVFMGAGKAGFDLLIAADNLLLTLRLGAIACCLVSQVVDPATQIVRFSAHLCQLRLDVRKFVQDV